MAKKRKNGKRPKDAYRGNNDVNDVNPNKATRSSPRRKNKNGQSNSFLKDSMFRTSLENDGLTIVDMNSDGNCLFRALSDQLYGDYGNRHDALRSDVCDYIQENEEEFKLFLVFEDDEEEQEEDAKDFDSYISNMREDGEWGGNLELVAAARLFQRRITVYSADMAAYTIDNGDPESTEPALLLCFHDGDHYNSVRKNDATPKPSNQRRKSPQKKKSKPDSSKATLDHTTASTATSLSELSVEDKKREEGSRKR